MTARVLDIFNVTYEVLLYSLGRFFAHGDEEPAQLRTLATASVLLMVNGLRPLGDLVTRMPVGEDHPGMNAGPSFEIFYRSGYLLPHAEAAWVVLHERLLELYGFLMATLPMGGPAELAPVGDSLLEIADKLAAQMPVLKERRIRVPPAWGIGTVPPGS
jgi:hypothetical protein